MMKIKTRLLLLTISMTTIALVITMVISAYLIREAVETDAEEKLSAVLEARHGSLVHYLDTVSREMHIIASSRITADSLHALSGGYAKLGKNAQTLLQQNYFAASSTKQKKSSLIGSDYDRAYTANNPVLLQRHEIYGWEDTILVDPKGNVVFSIRKAEDFGTNLIAGPWKDTGLARAVKAVLHNAVPGVLSFADFSHYAPINNLPAAFVAMPVFDTTKQVFLGVVAIQLPRGPINELMKNKTGLGETGETYVAGTDGWMLSDSFFFGQSTVLDKQLKTEAIDKVLNGESGFQLFSDYRGVKTFAAYKPIKPFQTETSLGDHPQWGVISKIDQEEVLKEFYNLRLVLLLSGSVLTLLAITASVWGARSVTNPLFAIRDALVKLSQGETVDVPALGRKDEIGDMAKAAEAFREMTQQVEHDHWIAENVSALTGAVSAESSIEKAADSVLHLLCERMAVPVGAIYLWSDEDYKRVGAHGLARRSQTGDSFQPGEGLLGQCAKDNQALVLSPVPAGLSIISTGLAEFPPHELVIYPISHKNEVLAVLELAAAKSLAPIQHEFLKAAAAALGLHLANLQASEHNLELLVETQKQSAKLEEQQEILQKSNEEMHALTEELRSQAEEMKAQNEELKTNQEELRSQQDEMKHKNQMLETQSGQLKEVIQEAENKARELESANRYKSEFLANMSHELRTPLNSVLILSKNLAENEENNLTPDQVESASVISESGTQLLTLINDILDLSKIEAGKLVLMKETFPLDELLAYLRRIFSAQAGKKNLAFNIRVDSDLAETIYTDRQRLTQVLSNLLSNAIKFTDSGEVKVLVGKDDDDLIFQIADSGIGIPTDKLEHIFGAFQQLDGSTSRKYGGSGLGLAISRHLAALLGGELKVESEPGKGSSFTLRLLKQFANPAQLEKADTKPLRETKVRQLSDGRSSLNAGGIILVVEDDTRLLTILGRMIQALGFTPLCVASAELAMEAVEKEIPAGILLDLGLPHMNGMELLKRLKQKKRTASIPVYIMSGSTDSGEAQVLGAMGFLKKPVTRDTILTAVRAMLASVPEVSLKRVLLVDDSAVDTKAIRTLFKQDEVEMVSASTGSRALQLLKTQRFDTVILDLQLPDMTGFEWLEQARHLLNPPPVVVYSARELSEAEVFELKETTESIVTKGTFDDRLREEVLATHAEGHVSKSSRPNFGISTGKKLLLVDDDARNLFALTKALRAKGFVIEVAANSTKALELLNLHRFDAVLTDIMMPDMDGYELIRQIRSLGYGDLPIVAITAKAMHGDDVLCMQAGASAYMSKPVDVTRLLQLLKGV
jgi:signal transduction histidine kinase/CheY-like chemotaxis protein